MNIDKAREEFEAAYVEDMVRIIGKGIRQRAFDNTKLVMQNGDFQDPALRLAFWAWQAGAKPVIAENERLERKNANQGETIKQYQDQVSGGDLSLGMLIAERDKLKHENAGLMTGYEAYEQVVRGLKADNEKLRNVAELVAKKLRSAEICHPRAVDTLLDEAREALAWYLPEGWPESAAGKGSK